MRTRRCTPGFGLQPAIGVVALDRRVADLMPASSPSCIFEDLDLVAVPLGPARVHAQEHRGPVLALGAAGAGMDLEIGVVAVGLAGEHGLDLAALGLGVQRPQRRLGFARRWPRRPRPRRARSVRSCRRAAARSRSTAAIWLFELLALAHQLLRALGRSFQKSGSSAAAFSSASRALARSQSKMPPQQAHRLLDLSTVP